MIWLGVKYYEVTTFDAKFPDAYQKTKMKEHRLRLQRDLYISLSTFLAYARRGLASARRLPWASPRLPLLAQVLVCLSCGGRVRKTTEAKRRLSELFFHS